MLKPYWIVNVQTHTHIQWGSGFLISCCSIFSYSFLATLKLFVQSDHRPAGTLNRTCSFQDDRHTDEQWIKRVKQMWINLKCYLFAQSLAIGIFNIDWDRCTPATIQLGLRCLGKQTDGKTLGSMEVSWFSLKFCSRILKFAGTSPCLFLLPLQGAISKIYKMLGNVIEKKYCP